MKKKGTILAENIIFIVLNLVFLTILLLFLFSKMGDPAVLEEKYAKQIALIIDSAKPEMEISLNMKNAINEAKGFEGKLISIDKNIVTVQLREKGGYSYSFFNDVDLSRLYFYFPPKDKDEKQVTKEDYEFKFTVEKYKNIVEENEETK